MFFTADEAAIVEAAVDRLIPPDERGPGGKDAGCAVFIDRQLAGPFGRSDGLYMKPPFMPGAATQGYQLPDAPAARYRAGPESARRACQQRVLRANRLRRSRPQDQDKVLAGLEFGIDRARRTSTPRSSSRCCCRTRMEGFFADPIYGGNRDMAGWKLVGFPGARYDYRDWVERHNEPYPLPPVSIMGRSDWTVRE